MTKTTIAAIAIATLGLAACAQDQTPSRVGAQSSAPDAAALGTLSPGGVGAGDNSTHSNGTGGGTGGGTGAAAQ